MFTLTPAEAAQVRATSERLKREEEELRRPRNPRKETREAKAARQQRYYERQRALGRCLHCAAPAVAGGQICLRHAELQRAAAAIRCRKLGIRELGPRRPYVYVGYTMTPSHHEDSN